MGGRRRTARLRSPLGALALAAAFAGLCALTSNPAGNVPYHIERHLAAKGASSAIGSDSEPISICGHTPPGANSQSYRLEHDLGERLYSSCPPYTSATPVLYLSGHLTFGRTANQLRSLTNAMQLARDEGYQLAIAERGWAMDVLLQFFLTGNGAPAASDDDEKPRWKESVERHLCALVIRSPEELEGREVVAKNPAELFFYMSPAPDEGYLASHLQILRTLFRQCNDGSGLDNYGVRSRDMCSGIDSVFGAAARRGEGGDTIYSAIHLRYMEGKPGLHFLKQRANATGCDPEAALKVTPEYVKSILAPLNMLGHPIVVITDGQKPAVLMRLQRDKVLGPLLRVVPQDSRWIGGDVTLAVGATLFIGNPASTFSSFIARSRIALGIGNNYLFRARDATGEWVTVCSDRDCLLRREVSSDETDEAARLDAIRVAEEIMIDARYKLHEELTKEEWIERKEAITATKKRKKMKRLRERQRQAEAQAEGGAAVGWLAKLFGPTLM
ncbi:hypothetical protein ACHAXT_008707 [Thalassiosira profunda]